MGLGKPQLDLLDPRGLRGGKFLRCTKPVDKQMGRQTELHLALS
jgi:hypothetical protein